MSGSRPRISVELATFLAVVVVAVARAPGAVGWLDRDGVIGAAALVPAPGHGAGAVLCGALAALVPVGEVAFRIALVSAVAVALAGAGVVALARALVPTAAGAGVIGAALLAISPAAGATMASGEGAVGAALAVWALVLVGREARRSDGPWPRARAAGAALAVGALATLSPLCAAVVAVPVGLGLWSGGGARRALAGLGLALSAVVIVIAPLVLRGDGVGVGALVGAGGAAAGAGLVTALGDGSGVVLLFAGLVGLGLGAATGLRGAGAVLGTAIASAVVVALAAPVGFALVPLAVFAAGLGPLAGAVARLGPEERRPLIATIAAVPLAAIAALTPRHAVPPDDAADGVARVAADLLGPVAAGPGVFVATEPTVYVALQTERLLTGLRGDLALVADLDRRRLAAELAAPRPVAADRPTVAEHDPRRSRAVGRGFELTADAPADDDVAVPPPPRYPGAGGRAVAALLGSERARREAARGHLDRAARAAGLAGTRFGAADLALLGATIPSPARPALYGFVPLLAPAPLPPPWLPELFGDDLAWVAGLDAPALPTTAPPARHLHALWRDVLLARRPADDPAILALGVAAGRATARLLADLDRPDAALAAAEAVLAHGDDGVTLLIVGSVLAERGGVGDDAPLDAPRTAALAAAEAALGRAVVAAPRLIDARVVLGLVQARQGRRDDARRTWQLGLEVAPGSAELTELLREPVR